MLEVTDSNKELVESTDTPPPSTVSETFLCMSSISNYLTKWTGWRKLQVQRTVQKSKIRGGSEIYINTQKGRYDSTVQNNHNSGTLYT